MEQYFPHGIAHYLAGGILLGLAVSFAFAMSGLITGMSTVFTSTWSYLSQAPYFQQSRFINSRQWRLALVVGLILGGALFVWSGGATYQTQLHPWQLGVGGFIAGFGARMSNGCTSGHCICGMGSLQLPSMLAVVTFLATAMITANVVHLLGGAP